MRELMKKLISANDDMSSSLSQLLSGRAARAVAPELLAVVGGVVPPLQTVPPYVVTRASQAPIPVVNIAIPLLWSVPPGLGPVVSPAVAAGSAAVTAGGGLLSRLRLPGSANRSLVGTAVSFGQKKAQSR